VFFCIAKSLAPQAMKTAAWDAPRPIPAIEDTPGHNAVMEGVVEPLASTSHAAEDVPSANTARHS
jgi:hypothetical protein